MARQSAADSSFEESEGEVRLVAKNTFLAVVEVPAAGAIARSQSDGALSISGSYQSSGWSSSRTSCASSATNSDALVWDAQLNLIEAREGTMRQLLRIAMSSDSAQQVPAPPSQARPADQGGESPPSKEQQQQQQKAQQFQLTGDWQLRFPLQQWHLQQHQEQQRQQQQTQPQSPQEKRLGSLPEEW
mmetsp:Transcript_100832/g.197889  ORF Transcript_100832/g.197889 Transcript_100832/m.197889 type:complete len:187 (-) Transcript_100832:272-832(-)